MEQFVSLGETGDLRPEAHLCAATKLGLTAAPQPLTEVQFVTPKDSPHLWGREAGEKSGLKVVPEPSLNVFEVFLRGAKKPIEPEALSSLCGVCKMITVLPNPPMNTLYLMRLSVSNYLDDIDPICLRWCLGPIMEKIEWNDSFSGVSSCHFWQRFFWLFVIKDLLFLLCFLCWSLVDLGVGFFVTS